MSYLCTEYRIDRLIAYPCGFVILLFYDGQFFAADVDRLHRQIIRSRDTGVVTKLFLLVCGDDLLFLFGEDDADIRDDQLLHISCGVR